MVSIIYAGRLGNNYFQYVAAYIFAKNFNNLVLSEGTFSWWIGFLSNAENIIYNERPRFWHGDIFVLPEWKFLNYN